MTLYTNSPGRYVVPLTTQTHGVEVVAKGDVGRTVVDGRMVVPVV